MGYSFTVAYMTLSKINCAAAVPRLIVIGLCRLIFSIKSFTAPRKSLSTTPPTIKSPSCTTDDLSANRPYVPSGTRMFILVSRIYNSLGNIVTVIGERMSSPAASGELLVGAKARRESF